MRYTAMRLARVYATALAAVLVAGLGAGCSRCEQVKVINHFGQPVRIRINGEDTMPLVPAHGERVLSEEFYIGPGVEVTVLTIEGRILKKKAFMEVPGDSFWRSIAVVEVRP